MRRIALPAYLVAVLVILFPLVDTSMSVWPPQPGEVAWRFGAAGFFSRALITPILGVLIAFAVALLLEHRRVLRGIALASAVVAALLVGVIGMFMLDALEMRSKVVEARKSAFDVASAVALVKYGAGMVVLLAYVVVGWKASGSTSKRKAAPQRRRAGADLVTAHAPAAEVTARGLPGLEKQEAPASTVQLPLT